MTVAEATTGELEVFGAGRLEGCLDILSVGRGHLKLTFAEGDDVEIEKAKRVIEDMIKRGFAIFVETEDGGTKRVKRFNKKNFTYIIDDTIDTVSAEKSPTREVAADKVKATGVGRTAGG